ncbi:histidine kinase [Bacillus manliponensis]
MEKKVRIKNKKKMMICAVIGGGFILLKFGLKIGSFQAIRIALEKAFS